MGQSGEKRGSLVPALFLIHILSVLSCDSALTLNSINTLFISNIFTMAMENF